MSIHFIGVDAGATATRALVATAAGAVVGRGSAAGANGWSSGTSPAHAIATAVEAALGAHAPATVANGVVGVAGAVSSVPEHAAAVARAWAALGISAPPRIIHAQKSIWRSRLSSKPVGKEKSRISSGVIQSHN